MNPKPLTFGIAVIVAVGGVIADWVTIPVGSGCAFWIVVLGFGFLAAGNPIGGF